MKQNDKTPGPIGVFDSGYGGLTILKDMRRLMHDYDFLYLGDNARAPYGTRSFEIVYEFTLQAVEYLFNQGCHLVILACNTASAKALRTIQQNDLARIDETRRVLGVIRPTVEEIGKISLNGNIGIFGTPGTVQSRSYELEIAKLYPHFNTYVQSCPMWVPLVENREAENPGADYFVKQEVDRLFGQCPDIDTVILGCTHYPLLLQKIRQYVPPTARIVTQGEIVAESLKTYLRRHPEMDVKCSLNGTCQYLTTENASRFSEMASFFMRQSATAKQIQL